MSVLCNESEAEDAAQETMIKVYCNLHMFRDEAQIPHLGFVDCAQWELGRLRKLAHRREDSLDAEIDEQTGDYIPAVLTNWREVPSEALERKELAVADLSENYHNIILLRDIEEMDVPHRETCEICSAFSIPRAT